MADVSQMSDDVSCRSFGGQADTSFFIKNGLVTNPIRFCLSKNLCSGINKMVFFNQNAVYCIPTGILRRIPLFESNTGGLCEYRRKL